MFSTIVIQFLKKYFTVELVIFFYFYGFLMNLPVLTIYVYERISDEKGFPYKNLSQSDDGSGCGGEGLGQNSTLGELGNEVQTLASQLGMTYNLVLTLLSLVVAPLWGPWTDNGGKRKPALLVAIMGACLEMVITLLVMYFDWSVYVLIVGAALNGLSGFATVLFVGATAYIADVSSKEERAFRIAVMYMHVFLAGVISQLTSGLWIQNVGFIPSAWFMLACYVLSGIWALFCVREIPRGNSNEKMVGFFSTDNIKCFINVFRKQRKAGRNNFLLLMVCEGVIFLSTLGIAGVKGLFILRSPLCWGPHLVGYYFAFEGFVHGVGSVVGIHCFGRCLKELSVVRISLVSVILALVMLAFSDRTWMVFVAVVVGVFYGVADPVLVGAMSRIASDEEQGAMFSAYEMVIALMQLIGAVLFNTVYQATLSLSFQGLVFLLCAVLILIPFVLVSFIELPPIEEDDKMKEDDELEMKQVQHASAE